MNVTYTRNGQEYKLDTATIPAASVDYLLQYGFAQSLQDTIAGLAKKKQSELEETDAFKNGNMTQAEIDDEIDLAIMAQLDRRLAAIREGTIGARVGVVKDPLTSLAREQVQAALKTKGAKVDKEKLAELVASHVEKNGDKLRAELARRKESQVDVEIDLD